MHGDARDCTREPDSTHGVESLSHFQRREIIYQGRGNLPGFADREELFAFFKANDVRDHSFTIEELERGRATMVALLNK